MTLNNYIKSIGLAILLIICHLRVSAQDLEITAPINPNNGCDLTATEQVSIVILNNSNTLPAFGGAYTLNYLIDGSGLVQENPGAPINPNATSNFTFTQDADLSACGPHEIKVWIDHPSDGNQNNDTITWTVQNDCTVIPGNIISNMLICEGSSDTLVLDNWTYGSIIDWEFSTDNGTSWNGLAITDTFFIFNNITVETQYQVLIDGGFCPNDISTIATVSVQTNPVAGTLDAPDSLCISNASGSIDIIGNSSGVLDWEFSVDDGATWSLIGNTNTTENFVNLTQTTWYRALIDGGACPDVYTDTAIIYIEDATVPGLLETDTLICEGQSVNLELLNNIGDILDWESSLDLVSWNSVNTTVPLYNTGSLSAPTYYRAIIENGICPKDTSNSVFVDVQAEVIPGTIDGAISTCASNATGVLELLGSSSTVVQWERSTNDGITWTPIVNATTTEAYNNLNQTTWYRVLVDGGVCNDAYSDTAIIAVDPLSEGGTLTPDTSVCEGDVIDLTVTGFVGDIQYWLASTDGGSTWTTINETTPIITTNPMNTETIYQVVIQSGICQPDSSNTIIIDVLPLPAVDAGADVTIMEGDTTTLAGSGGATGIWMPGSSLSDSTIQAPDAYPTSTTNYIYTVIGANTCLNSDDVTISVDPPYPPFSIKNTITANNDGYNDTWIIEGIEAFPSTFVAVYNIYGKEIYSNEDYQNEWNGMVNGNMLPNGTYMFIVIPGGTDNEIKGNLTIMGDE
jgi:gliding motility-associated-like protein